MRRFLFEAGWNARHFVARFLHIIKIKPRVSTTICDDVSIGYGKLDFNGYWQFPLKTIERGTYD